MEFKLEHVFVVVAICFLFKMIMDKCGCRGKNPIEGYADMNECYIDWGHGNIDTPEGNGCPSGTQSAVTQDVAYMVDNSTPNGGHIYHPITYERWGETNYGWFWNDEIRQPYDALTQLSCHHNLGELCKSLIDDAH